MKTGKILKKVHDFNNSVHDKSDCNPQVEASNTDSETLRTFNEGLLQL